MSHNDIVQRISAEMNELLMESAETTSTLSLDTATKSGRLIALDILTNKLERAANWLKAARKHIK